MTFHFRLGCDGLDRVGNSLIVSTVLHMWLWTKLTSPSVISKRRKFPLACLLTYLLIYLLRRKEASGNILIWYAVWYRWLGLVSGTPLSIAYPKTYCILGSRSEWKRKRNGFPLLPEPDACGRRSPDDGALSLNQNISMATIIIRT